MAECVRVAEWKNIVFLGDVFTASCDVEPTSCAFAWLMLWLSVVAHAMHYCVTNESDDDDETNTMYS